ncbi:MAG: type I-C CRISPR-associated protein Cas8c/Csd1 [Helicobacteraceae bacterium]|jgi:CRISPR-associated protein Csd1|nr:type I-C CRISPR-associated protein Cas8c/Csd1 [Helicobacteraceae bacterium]
MILQALKEYYDRKAADPDGKVAPEGWEWKEIPFIVVLNDNGSLVQIEDTKEGDGAKKRGKVFLVPQGVKKTSGPKANLLWDTANYALGIPKAEQSEDEARKQKNDFFIKKIIERIPDSAKKSALLKFLSECGLDALKQTPQYADIAKSNPNVSFRFNGELQLYCRSDEVIRALSTQADTTDANGLCLVTGKQDQISALHTAIKGVWGAQTSGSNIVSFNLDAFCSYGKKQGFNAPIGKKAMFAYTTGLNMLLDRDSKQRMQIADASTVFWSDRKTRFEENLSYYFAEPPKDDPDAGTRRIAELFSSVNNGAYVEDTGDERFFMLGLSPNAARISVRFWRQGTVAQFATNIKKHFEDLEIVKPESEPKYYSLWRLLVNIAIQDKSQNIPPNIAGDFMCSILDGKPYPASLLQAALRRVKSDADYRVKPVRAALIKACLNRANHNTKEVLKVALDPNQQSIGYQLGRLFATLDKIQEEAMRDINSTIRDRYYGAACGSPSLVFPTLMRLKNHHLSKMDNKGRAVNLERLIGEIAGHFFAFPSRLTLDEQGRFAIGYYHQRQDFFKPKNEENNKRSDS